MFPGIASIAGLLASAAAPVAEIQFVGYKLHEVVDSASAQVISLSGTLTGGIDSSPAVGDFIVVSWNVGTIGVDLAPTTPSGYTLDCDLWPNDTYEANLHVWHIIAGSGDLSSVTVAGPGSGFALQVAIRVYRGVHQTTPLDVAVVPAQGTNSGRPDPGAITPVTAGAWILVIGSAADANSSAFTQGGDLTDFVSNNRMHSVDSTIGFGHKTNWTSGAFNPAAWTGGATATSSSWSALTMALRPA